MLHAWPWPEIHRFEEECYKSPNCAPAVGCIAKGSPLTPEMSAVRLLINYKGLILLKYTLSYLVKNIISPKEPPIIHADDMHFVVQRLSQNVPI